MISRSRGDHFINLNMRFFLYPWLVFCIATPVAAATIERIVVQGSGFSRESAIGYTEEIAITRVMEKYARAEALNVNRTTIRYRILDRSSSYLDSFTILTSYIDEQGAHHITAEARVSLDRLLTSLRNLDVDVKMWAPGPDQAIEGRRGAGRKTGPDRFDEDLTD